MIGAAPFVVLGFVKYNGMTAEKFIWAWIKSEILYPKKLTFKPTNLYEQVMRDIEKENMKNSKKTRGVKNKIENIKKDIQARQRKV